MSHDADIVTRILALKEQRRAVILAHNYQVPKVQDIADFGGDSLELSRKAATTDAEVIVFCGVHFMAETAKLLSPEKTVLLPDLGAGCPMADMITGEELRQFKLEHPGAVVVCYVNSTAEVKAQSDVCCTSSNAADIIRRIPEHRPVLFVPDQYLGGHVQRLTGRELVLWPGYCPTHARLLPEHIEEARAAHPGAPVVVHPECRAETCLAADEVLSTGQMVQFARTSPAQVILVGTEEGLLHRLRKENPTKTFTLIHAALHCPNMKKVNLEKILWSLEELAPSIEVPSDIAIKARLAVERMLGHGSIDP
ncbi:MAG: quinolinate synthase NadA [Myxococcota bacterium]|nr:quinolinate synthase NadA [Myxococcota bacterium]